MSAAQHNPWDTPPDGDFASYVERLSASPAQGNAAPHHSGAAPAPVATPPGVPHPLQRMGRAANQPGWIGLLRTARAVAALLTAGQAVALLGFHWGFFPLLFATALVWTLLSAMIRSLGNPLAALGGVLPESQPPHEDLRPLAHPRKTGNKQ